MNISKPIKVLIGVLTLFAVIFPFIIMPAFVMLFMFGGGFPFIALQSAPDISETYRYMFPFMLVFYPLMMCFSLIQLGLQIFYVIHVIKNKALTETYRILFAIGTFLLPYVTMPIYFIIYLWKDTLQQIDNQITNGES